MRRCLRRIPRPSLLWMSINDVVRVRNELSGLYLAPGQKLELPRPHEVDLAKFKLFYTYVSGGSGSTPLFEWSYLSGSSPKDERAWLKVHEGKPMWEQVSSKEPGSNDLEAHRYPFNHPKFWHLAIIIKHLAGYFPFSSTDNYLVNGGKPIA